MADGDATVFGPSDEENEKAQRDFEARQARAKLEQAAKEKKKKKKDSSSPSNPMQLLFGCVLLLAGGMVVLGIIGRGCDKLIENGGKLPAPEKQVEPVRKTVGQIERGYITLDGKVYSLHDDAEIVAEFSNYITFRLADKERTEVRFSDPTGNGKYQVNGRIGIPRAYTTVTWHEADPRK